MSRDPKVFVDGLSTVEGGVDSGKVPILLRQNQLHFGVNCYIRGGFLRPRAALWKIDLKFNDNAPLEQKFKTGYWQVAGYYKPDSGSECILCSIGGRQFRVNVATDKTVQEITITFNTTTTANFVPPAIDFNVTISVLDTSKMSAGSTIVVNGNNYLVVTVLSPTSVAIKNIDDAGLVNPVPSGSLVQSFDPNPSNRPQAWEVQAENYWVLRDGQSIPFIYDGATSRRAASNVPVASGREIGPGRMMAYVMGRIWGALTDLYQYRAGDLVYSALYGRAAVLKETENTFLNGGGDFTTPTTAGGITSMKGLAQLDTSLGQGPLQVLTEKYSFSNQSPVDRTAWASLENPIQTVSSITNGGLSHYSSVLVNGDLFYRAMDGIRSLKMARKDFESWGNTPVSREMSRVLDLDEETLLPYSSAVVFDNRLLMTASPFRTTHGIIHRGWISLDFDLISSIGQKAPPVYDGLEIGLNTLQIVQGEFNNEERCFMFGLNAEQEIELYELTKKEKFDRQSPYGADIPISWIFETASFRFNSAIFPEPKILKKLSNCEIHISDLVGTVHFKVYFKPDNYPCWILWKEFEECQTYKNCDLDPLTGCQTIENFKPGFRPRISLGEPPESFDENNNRPLNNAYSFQLRFEISGYCEITQINLLAHERLESFYGEVVEDA